MTYNLLHQPRLVLPASWGLVFLSVNGVMLWSLLTEDEGLSFSTEEILVFEEHFQPFGVTPTQFHRVMQRATWCDASPG